jgi:hypothetical protein
LGKKTRSDRTVLPNLTNREFQILQLFGEAKGIREIVSHFHLSPISVKTHGINMMRNGAKFPHSEDPQDQSVEAAQAWTIVSVICCFEMTPLISFAERESVWEATRKSPGCWARVRDRSSKKTVCSPTTW